MTKKMISKIKVSGMALRRVKRGRYL